jgi:cytochrome c-type biogenesis protein CcmH/NrfG
MPPEANEAPTDIQSAAAKGVFEKIKSFDFVQLLVVALLSLIAYGIYWAVGEVKWYGSAMEASHKEERIQRDQEHTKQITEITTTFERTMDRFLGKQQRAAAAGEAARVEMPSNDPPGT